MQKEVFVKEVYFTLKCKICNKII